MLFAVRAVHGDSPTIEITRLECPSKPPVVIESSDVLNDVARELSLGLELDTAVDGSAYAAARADSLYIKKGSPLNDEAIREIIVDRYCTAPNDWRFTEFGTYRANNEEWIVLAVPRERPAVEDPAAVAERVLELVNAARKQSRRCGDREISAAPPLSLSPALIEAASRHARDMARHGAFAHLGSDGSQPGERLLRAGYRWRTVGENIAAGQSGADAVVTDWLDSPEHCSNMMGRQFSEMGVGFAIAPSGDPVIYWAQEFASPR
jgi:uncharacterized protein YkwD